MDNVGIKFWQGRRKHWKERTTSVVLLGWDNSLKEPRTSDAFKLSFVIVQSPIYRVFSTVWMHGSRYIWHLVFRLSWRTFDGLCLKACLCFVDLRCWPSCCCATTLHSATWPPPPSSPSASSAPGKTYNHTQTLFCKLLLIWSSYRLWCQDTTIWYPCDVDTSSSEVLVICQLQFSIALISRKLKRSHKLFISPWKVCCVSAV